MIRIKIFFLILISYYLIINNFTAFKLRGIVEGFYGPPWSFEDRADLIQFCGENNLNAYIYAPKDDSYHRDKWRVPYPKDKLEEFKKLINLCNENKVKFIFAVSPGLDLNFIGDEADKDFNLLMEKLDSIYKIGCRYFAIFFDDLKKNIDSGLNQAIFLNKVNKELRNKYSDINRLITVPIDFYILSMFNKDGKLNEYTSDFSNNLNKNIIVLFTGYNVMSDGISEKDYSIAYNIYKKNVGIWWNYPVNDYLKSKLALGYIEKLPTNINYIFFNPMQQVQLSKIALATGAEFSNFPNEYNPYKSWNKAIEKQFGKNAHAMKIFASHSQHMHKKSDVGPKDSPEFYAVAHQAVLDSQSKKKFNFSQIIELIDEMENSADSLLKNLEKKILSECELHLQQFKRIIKADRIAVKSLKEGKLDSQLKKLRKDIDKYKKEAILSEESAIKFIDEVIELYN